MMLFWCKTIRLYGLIPVSDIDECSPTNFCGEKGKCTNEEGSYKCECDSGYKFDPKAKPACVGEWIRE